MITNSNDDVVYHLDSLRLIKLITTYIHIYIFSDVNITFIYVHITTVDTWQYVFLNYSFYFIRSTLLTQITLNFTVNMFLASN